MMMYGGGLLDNGAAAVVGPIPNDSAGVGATVLAGAAVRPDRMAAYFPTNRDIDVQMGLPMLDSLPGAATTLYLDFDGNFMSSWTDGSSTFTNINTPVFDTDGNTAAFSATEQAQIKDVWARVAEDYAPFNINVSTDYYGSFDGQKALHVVIGGDNSDWLHQNASGISFIGSFANNQPNVVFAFDMFHWAAAGVEDGSGRALVGAAAQATTISHEAGHAFGLRHHALYNVDGDKLTNYDPGGGGWTAIMGDNLESDRTTWADGPTDQGPNTYQNDVAVISSTANGFGLRADDHADTTAGADLMTSPISVMGAWTGKGIINGFRDYDVMSFTTTGGDVTIDVKAAANGPNLIPVASLLTASGFVANANAGSMTESIIHATVPAGTYYVQIHGFGDFGDMGQYTVSAKTALRMAVNPNVAGTTSLTGAQTIPTSALNTSAAPVGGSSVKGLKTAPMLTSSPSTGARGAGSDFSPIGNLRRDEVFHATTIAEAVTPIGKNVGLETEFDVRSLDAVFDLLA
jgi:hypothetical protein